jgi:hypothetical protein
VGTLASEEKCAESPPPKRDSATLHHLSTTPGHGSFENRGVGRLTGWLTGELRARRAERARLRLASLTVAGDVYTAVVRNEGARPASGVVVSLVAAGETLVRSDDLTIEPGGEARATLAGPLPEAGPVTVGVDVAGFALARTKALAGS